MTRYYFGGALETSGSSVKKYYSFAGQMVAMKDNGVFKYFLSDHLGSVSLVLDDQGGILEGQRYLPFGEPRTMAPYADVTSTDFTYTGQRALPDTGLMDYNARFYSPSLKRFIQPDTIIPGAANPQSWNRYSYVLNNPILFNDPTGHDPYGTCGGNPYCIDYVEQNPELDFNWENNNGGGGEPSDDDGGDDDGSDCDLNCELEDGHSGGHNAMMVSSYLYDGYPDDYTCGNSEIGCQRIGNVLILRMGGQTITINLLLPMSEAERELISEFKTMADTRSEHLGDFWEGAIVGTISAVVAVASIPTDWTIGGAIITLGSTALAVAEYRKAYYAAKDLKTDYSVLQGIWTELQPSDITP